MDADQNVILLDTAARIWDATGSTAADRIRLDQRTGDFLAEGNVQFQPPARQGPEEELRDALRRRAPAGHRAQDGLAQSQPHDSLRGRTPTCGRAPTAYRRVWTWIVDPQKRTLVADGHVVTNLWEEPKEDRKSQEEERAPPVLTEVHAAHMVYTEEDRLATTPAACVSIVRACR